MLPEIDSGLNVRSIAFSEIVENVFEPTEMVTGPIVVSS
jgi:hypothetical protein